MSNVPAAVIYDFSGYNFTALVQFQITSPDIITSLEEFHASDLDYCINCYEGTDAFAVVVQPVSSNGEWLEFSSSEFGPPNSSFVDFPNGTFSTPGTYTNGSSTLEITTTPELGSLSLLVAAMLAGLSGLAVFRGRIPREVSL